MPHWIHCRRIIASIVVHPSLQDGIELMGYVLEPSMRLSSKIKLPDLPPHGFNGCRTDPGTEAREHFFALKIFHVRWPEAISEEVELRNRMLAFAPSILAVDDPGFVRMHFQLAFSEPGCKLCLYGYGFSFCSAVYQSVICIPTPREVWVLSCHPRIKRVVQKKICQHRTDNAALGGALRARKILCIRQEACHGKGWRIERARISIPWLA